MKLEITFKETKRHTIIVNTDDYNIPNGSEDERIFALAELVNSFENEDPNVLVEENKDTHESYSEFTKTNIRRL